MIYFGEFTLDTTQARLLKNDSELPIDPKLFELLLLFVKQPNTLLSRQHILDNLWSGSLVTDNAINKLIANLRKVLSDDPRNPKYIQTVPKRGYRFICETKPLGVLHASKLNQLASNNIAPNNQRNMVLTKIAFTVIMTLLLLLGGLFYWYVLSDEKSTKNIYTMELTRASGAEESARMHPDNNHLYYLKKASTSTPYQLWMKNIHTAKTKRIDIGKTRMNEIIAMVATPDNETTTLFYLDKRQNSCGVYQAVLTSKSHKQQINQTIQWQQTKKLFDCSDKRLKDIDYHADKKRFFYAAQPKNFWPNQIYSFDLTSKKHRLVTQVEPVGWGHHSIDISPDGNKLLIMSTNGDYKTQLLALNILSNEITEGVKFDYPVSEAIWHHDSKQVYYYAAPPAHQIMKSDFNGNNAMTVVSVSEYLSPRMSLFPDGKNLLFSTEQKNYSNRWLLPPKQISKIDNSTVYDIQPALFHHSDKYLFISKRSGRRQLYLGRYSSQKSEIVTNFSQAHWFGYLSVSADDKSVLVNVENKVYCIPTSDLNEMNPLTTLPEKHLIFTSKYPIISIDWLTENGAAITNVKNGIPELIVVNVVNKRVQPLNGKWAYGLTDNLNTAYSYVIEQQTNTVYRTNALNLSDHLSVNSAEFITTKVSLPSGFFHVKIDANILYYGSNENNSVYLNAVPLNDNEKKREHQLNDFNGYDVSNNKIMISDIESFEGDVHRTVH